MDGRGRWRRACSAAGGDAPTTYGRVQGELLGQNAVAGHRLRERRAPRLDALEGAPVERVGVAIVGAGPAGLSAAYRLGQLGAQGVCVFELEAQIGGTSRAGVTGAQNYPWGAHYLPLPQRSENPELVALLEEMGALEPSPRGPAAVPEGRESMLVREPESRVYFQGFWERGLFPRAGRGGHRVGAARPLSDADGFVRSRAWCGWEARVHAALVARVR